MAENNKVEERTLEETPTWAVAVVCFVMIALSLGLEHLLHRLEKWLHSRHKKALHEALEKVKAELMLMGFISLLLTIGQYPISGICVSPSIADTWHPCKNGANTTGARRVLSSFYSAAATAGGGDASTRRILASIRYDKCADEGDKVAFVSAYGIHQLHIFIFVLAIFHVIYGLTTLALGSTKMKRWESWEAETRSIEHQYQDDPDRFRFARDTSFGRRHLNNWSSTSITLWIVCFFRQFKGSVTKVDYFTLRHGFIMAHLPPGSETKFDFHKYISRSLEQDFVVVVGITPLLWFISILFLMTNTYGWVAYLWLPFIPLIILLLVGTKLQVIITELGLRIQERGKVVRGAPVVQPGDELFWFKRPRLILFLIHLVLFQNAFQLAFFIWTLYTFGIRSCFHEKLEDILIRVIMGIIIQILCSYVTLPLYALVTQMGTTMKPTIFNERVAEALKNWHHSARKNTRHGTPISSRPASPSRSRGVSPVPSRSRGMSPVHLLHTHPTRSNETYRASPSPPRCPSYDEDNDRWDPESLHSPRQYRTNDHHGEASAISEQEMAIQEPPGPISTPNKISKSPSGFSFGKRGH